MMLIPRFYYIVNNKNYNFHIERKRKNKKRYIVNNFQESQRFFVYYDAFCNGKFINIDDTFYYRPDWDKSRDWVFNNICMKYDITDENGHIMFQRPTGNLNKKYPYHQDLYHLFYTFSDFEEWLYQDRTKLIWKVLPYKKYDIDSYKEMFVSYIQRHFEDNDGNIFLLKVKFKRNDPTL